MSTIDAVLVGDGSLLLAGQMGSRAGVCRLDEEGWHNLSAEVMEGVHLVDLRILADGRILAIGVENFFGAHEDAGPEKQRPVAWVSADGGETWEELWRAEDHGFVSGVAVDDDGRVWLCGARVEVSATLELGSLPSIAVPDYHPVIWRPNDADSWTGIEIGGTGRANDLVVMPDAIVVVGTAGLRVRDTSPIAWLSEAGVSWSEVSLPPGASAHATGVIEWADGFVAIGHDPGEDGRIWISPTHSDE